MNIERELLKKIVSAWKSKDVSINAFANVISEIKEELANPEPKSLTVEQINNMIANNILYGKSDFSIIDLIKEVEKHHGITK